MAGFNLNICAGRGGAAAQLAVAAAFTAAWLVPNSTKSAVANGDTRTVILSDQHTNESGSFTFMVNGVYDQAVLDKLNWFCRDWRLNEPTKMDPHLFDIIWEVYRESGSTQPVDVLSGYRSPHTNAMLRRRSRLVAEHSQHMQGKAIDAHFLDVSTGRIRDIAMRMQAGGVGFYPTGMTPWVHIDSGSVRYWPKMSRDALTRLFPDGKTVFIPADGKPMPGYELARAEIEARGGNVQVARGGGIGGLFSWLFGGGGADDAEESGGGEATTTMATTGNARGGRSGGPQPQVEVADAGPEAVAKAKRDLPTGQAYASARRAGAGRQAAGARFGAGGGGEGRAQLADRSGLRQRRRFGADAAGQVTDCRRAGAAKPGQGRFAGRAAQQSRAEADRAAAAAQASRSRGSRIRQRAHASGSSGGSDPGFNDRSNRRRFSAPSNKGFGPAAQRGLLPPVILSGVDRAPTGALALAEGPSSQIYDDTELLARAAALTAPLPPMPIANVLVTAAVPANAVAPDKTAAPQEHGWVVRTAALAAEDLGQLFQRLPFGVFKAAAPAHASPEEPGGSQQ